MLFLFLWWLFLAILAYNVLVYLLEKLEISGIDEKTVLITGCDSGFGKELVFKCLKNEMTVFAGCLTEKVCIF